MEPIELLNAEEAWLLSEKLHLDLDLKLVSEEEELMDGSSAAKQFLHMLENVTDDFKKK